MFLKCSWEQLPGGHPWLRACHVAYPLALIHSTVLAGPAYNQNF